jgi:HD-GYP domain-containing protein (c-di-GMP phosphodiesterase class II)
MARRLNPGREFTAWSRLLTNHAAMTVLGALGSLLGVAYLLVGPVILPLVLLTYVTGHVGFASWSRLRQAHEATIRGFVKALEALDPYTKGHTERVVGFVDMIGRRLGLSAQQLGLLRWSALIHDVGKVAVPPDLLRREGPLEPAERLQMIRHMGVVEGLLAEVESLRPMVAVASQRHAVDEGEGGSLEARVLAAAAAFDSMTSSRSHGAAVAQADAFAELTRRSQAYGADVVEALIEAVSAHGEVYGRPDEESTGELARLVKERAIRA